MNEVQVPGSFRLPGPVSIGGNMALKDAKMLYTNLSVYDRTFIEMMQAIIASGNYAPGPLIVQLAEDATLAALSTLGYDLADKPVPVAHEWTVWKN